MCRFSKRNCFQKFLPATQSLLVFAARSYGELIFLALGSWAVEPGVGLGLLAPEISLSNFYSPHVGISVSPPLLPVWMTVVSGLSNAVVFGPPFNLISDGYHS